MGELVKGSGIPGYEFQGGGSKTYREELPPVYKVKTKGVGLLPVNYQ